MSTIQIGVRLQPEDVAELDRVAAERRELGGQLHANRSDILRELITWARREGFFGPKKRGRR